MKVQSAALLAVTVTLFLRASYGSLPLNMAEVTGYEKLRSCKSSSLYQVQTDAGYTHNPLLIHLVGSRYGKTGTHFCTDTKMNECALVRVHF